MNGYNSKLDTDKKKITELKTSRKKLFKNPARRGKKMKKIRKKRDVENTIRRYNMFYQLSGRREKMDKGNT